MDEKEPRNIDLSIGDPEPSDIEERAQYVARVAAFFQDILNPKLERMKSQQAVAMQDPSEDMMMTQYRRGAINAFALLQDWGDLMVSELQDMRKQIDLEEIEEENALDS